MRSPKNWQLTKLQYVYAETSSLITVITACRHVVNVLIGKRGHNFYWFIATPLQMQILMGIDIGTQYTNEEWEKGANNVA